MTTDHVDWPPHTLPPAEAETLQDTYAAARVILEYGSGGSTLCAARMRSKRVFSVESDRDWALRLQRRLEAADVLSPVTVYHAEIGPTGEWGRPMGPGHWQSFQGYPLAIWNEPFFRHPDVALIDGRFRAACMVTIMALAQQRMIVLFDDYLERPRYHIVEHFLSPVRFAGRMAVFEVEPGLVSVTDLGRVMRAFAQATYAGERENYARTDNTVKVPRQDETLAI